MKKVKFFCLSVLFVALLFFFVSFVSAHFVCGVVNDSSDFMSASWMRAELFYPSNPSLFTTCEVSPEDNKYCCDAESIPPVDHWDVGAEVGVRLADVFSGYAAGPVYLTTTGEGYDVAPTLVLQKVIERRAPLAQFWVSNTSFVFLNATFFSPYTSVILQTEEGNETLCVDCTSFAQEIATSHGTHDWTLFATDGNTFFADDFSFTFLEGYSFSRDFVCSSGCSNARVRSGSEVNVSLDFSFSHAVTSLEYKEFVPVDWDILDSGSARVENYSNTHRVLVWNLSGTAPAPHYVLRAPTTFFRPYWYTFSSSLGNVSLPEQRVLVALWFFVFFGGERPIEAPSLQPLSLSRYSISPERPLVLRDFFLFHDVALFPLRSSSGAMLDVVPLEHVSGLEGDVFAYTFVSNLENDSLDHYYARVSLPRSSFETLPTFYYFDTRWHERSFDVIEEKNDSWNVEVSFPYAKNVAFVRPRVSFFKRFFA